MNSSFYRFILDVQSVQSQVSIPASLYDTARTLYISFTDGGKPYFIETGCLAKLTITRPSGSKLHEFCAIEGNASVVYSFEQNEYTAAEEGIHECEVTLYGFDGEQITSPRFTMVVSERVVNKDDNNGLDDESLGIIDDICHSEQERRQAELVREGAESIRATAESDRVASEAKRITAEEARASAEEARVEGYNRIDHDTSEAINKILYEQESILALQNALIENGTTQERLANIIELMDSYIGGDTE